MIQRFHSFGMFFRVLYIAVSLKDVQGWEETDVIYDPLPLYHTAGGLIGIMPTLSYGMTTVLRSKFSASNYFPDCVKYKCTVSTYFLNYELQRGSKPSFFLSLLESIPVILFIFTVLMWLELTGNMRN